ncbi:hypothetical protein AM1BK_12640 [Neobacillus kokaensis]|uniref:Polysaccharide biosynthesis protein C-terminal domain-containing protein n=2 Tax=Neobacillus kokaensis TaxID=2759023 RepID=A0ABQ3N8S2_9BACI|nr:hypothetical protein AM1BK_12640 [Neobacillus kokaensis]
MFSGLISTIYSNIYFILIGRMHTAVQLGYYTNAVKLNEVVSDSIASAILRVTYPVLSSIQDNEERLKYGFKRIIKTTNFINFPFMVGLAAIAQPLILLIFGERWKPMVVYFQLLCFAGMLYPLNAINLNIFQVKGKSDLYLKLNIVKRVILTILITVAVYLDFGILGLIGVCVIDSYIGFLITSFFSGKEVSYSLIEQIKDLLFFYIISIFMGVIVYLFGIYAPIGNFFTLIFQIIIGFVVYLGICMIAKVQEIYIIWELIAPILKRIKTKRFNDKDLNY